MRLSAERIESRIELALRALLLTSCPRHSARLREEISLLRETLANKRDRERAYQARHRKFQRTLIADSR